MLKKRNSGLLAFIMGIMLVAVFAFAFTACGDGGENGNGNGSGNGTGNGNGQGNGGGTDPRPSSPQTMSSKTAMQYFTDEGLTVGINVGNTLDAVINWVDSSYPAASPTNPIAVETAWGNPKANQAYFNGVKNLGFKIVRIPVTWLGHIGSAPDYKIEEAYLVRVAEVVNMAHNAGLKAFINIHHDGHHDFHGWLDIVKAASDQTVTDKYVKVWTQIAEYFKNYGDYLMFQGFNEIHDGSWKAGGSQAEYNIINDWNQKFTNAVRGTGGNNASRYLLYYGYMVSTEIATDSKFILPTDTASGKQIVGFHYYSPWEFQGAATNTAYTTADENALKTAFAAFKTKYVDNNIPVIIGENGPSRYANHSANPGYSAANAVTAKANRLNFIDLLYGTARSNGIVPFFWENGTFDASYTEGDFSLINRSNGQANSTESAEVIQRMITAINSAAPPGGGTPPAPPPGGNAVDLGSYTYGLQEDGVTANYQQAVWNLTPAQVTAAKASGAKLVLQLSSAPADTMQFVWQNPATESWWNSKDILGSTGSPLNSSVTWNAGTKTLTINLDSNTVNNYTAFTTAASLNLILAYYGSSNIDDLGITSARLE
uniref:Glycoside hydrolase family 5 n=1 Tax=uncultured bacterium contig00003 TaxID=1181495 RepID=A0A806KGM7_9BACT|nr:glycoside hydrolase family 5 [uncultured bacterium contig00003]